MRDIKTITAYAQKMMREAKEKVLFRNLRKEVNVGANGTQDYVIKNGDNAGKLALERQQVPIAFSIQIFHSSTGVNNRYE
jgi:hypothetical protein